MEISGFLARAKKVIFLKKNFCSKLSVDCVKEFRKDLTDLGIEI